jgi:proline racemase
MRARRVVSVIDTHTQGTAERIVVSGVPSIPGATMVEKQAYVARELDGLRRFVVNEPRGHRNMCASFLTEPVSSGADLGVIFLEPGGYASMCGHGAIAICTALVDTGRVELKEPRTQIVLDTVAGRIQADVEVRDGEAVSVTLTNVPAFLFAADASVDVKGLGRVSLDIAYGGNFYAILPADAVGLTIEPQDADDLIICGKRIWEAVNDQVEVQHPLTPSIRGVSYVQFSGAASSPDADARNAVTSPPWNMDRSPCGTGTSAKMAAMYARGEIQLGEDFVHESILGGTFRGRLLEEVDVDGRTGVLSTITGSAYIMGFHQFVLDGKDPFPQGFILGRTTRSYGTGESASVS